MTESVGTETMLLVVMRTAQTDAENIMRPLTGAGIRRRAQMREVDRACITIGDATAMRPDPAPMSRPDLLHGRAHPQLWPLQPIGQPHDRLSTNNGGSEFIGGMTIAIGHIACGGPQGERRHSAVSSPSRPCDRR